MDMSILAEELEIAKLEEGWCEFLTPVDFSYLLNLWFCDTSGAIKIFLDFYNTMLPMCNVT